MQQLAECGRETRDNEIRMHSDKNSQTFHQINGVVSIFRNSLVFACLIHIYICPIYYIHDVNCEATSKMFYFIVSIKSYGFTIKYAIYAIRN